MLPEIRKAKFREEIGWVNESALYSSVDVPILHKNWSGEYSLSSIFLNPKLMGLYVSMIRGPTAGKYFMNGHLMYPTTDDGPNSSHPPHYTWCNRYV